MCPEAWKTKSSSSPSANYFVIKLRMSFTETLITNKLSLCYVKYVGCKNSDHMVDVAGCVVEKGLGWTEPGVKLHHPPGLHPLLPCCWAWATRGLPLTPSRPLRWCQKDVFGCVLSGCAKMKGEEEKGSCSTAVTSRTEPVLSMHLFSRDVLQRKPDG